VLREFSGGTGGFEATVLQVILPLSKFLSLDELTFAGRLAIFELLNKRTVPQ
jgi:hypothetical protein